VDFKWEMQERVDRGMSPDQAYNATRDSFAGFYDNREKFKCDCNDRNVCNCTCDADCECKNPVNEGPIELARFSSMCDNA
jgi:hypothetical protein